MSRQVSWRNELRNFLGEESEGVEHEMNIAAIEQLLFLFGWVHARSAGCMGAVRTKMHIFCLLGLGWARSVLIVSRGNSIELASCLKAVYANHYYRYTD